MARDQGRRGRHCADARSGARRDAGRAGGRPRAHRGAALTPTRRKPAPIARAFDAIEFGGGRTLDLRAQLPTPLEAETRLETWLRERQAIEPGDVLVITGRGRASVGGVAMVKPAVLQRLARLRRQGVVSAVREHTPGSFVVTVAPFRALLDAAARRRDPPTPPPATRETLAGLAPATLDALRTLAMQTLETLGVPRSDRFVADEMARQFSRLLPAAGNGGDREARLRDVVRAAIADGDA